MRSSKRGSYPSLHQRYLPMSSLPYTDDLASLYHAALIHEKAGNFIQAAPLYRQCLKLDPQDHCGATMRLASMGMGPMPKKAGDAYVATLFDQHAERFDQILTEDLGYAVPVQLASHLALLERRFEHGLDLGCGTGLTGACLLTICETMIGVDLSEKMIDKADERQAYDSLYVHEACDFLTQWRKAGDAKQKPDTNLKTTPQPSDFEDLDHNKSFDLITATDVLPYLGDLTTLIREISANLKPGGILGLSCETLPDSEFDGKPWMVTPHQRFAHHCQSMIELIGQYGIDIIHNLDPITVRTEEGTPIPGWLLIAEKSVKGLTP